MSIIARSKRRAKMCSTFYCVYWGGVSFDVIKYISVGHKRKRGAR